MIRHWLSSALLALGTVALISACSEVPEEDTTQLTFQAGAHYRVLEFPVHQDRNEPFIVEYLWVGCPYCQQFEPILQGFKAENPEVTFVRRHGSLTNRWIVDGRIFHAIDLLADHDMTPAILEFYASKAPNLPGGEDLAQFVEEQGLDADEVFAKADSDEVNAIMADNLTDMDQNGMRGVPAIVVNGRYLVSNSLPENIATSDDYYALLNYLLSLD
ncbi:thiol:disulfide interchange protein DsbA/DsbL [Aliidiomarina indica]|uniref:thiol:disulfide interchange protein DsbA/DsbL n=1 Tax=Aliidiomarina indica TaxID=2749147 RepID=UPI00188DECF7|nr:thiol:disulfide interchange protein DsbA/DsbL [Aliidiomarina indica]